MYKSSFQPKSVMNWLIKPFDPLTTVPALAALAMLTALVGYVLESSTSLDMTALFFVSLAFVLAIPLHLVYGAWLEVLHASRVASGTEGIPQNNGQVGRAN